MDEQKARLILGIPPDLINPISTGLWIHTSAYIDMRRGEATILIDGDVTAEQLEAIAWWKRNKVEA
jgi:hypothetical protein